MNPDIVTVESILLVTLLRAPPTTGGYTISNMKRGGNGRPNINGRSTWFWAFYACKQGPGVLHSLI